MTQRSQIIEILTALPGSTMPEISSLMPNYKNPSGEVAYMLKKGMIRVEKNDKNKNRYFMNNEPTTKKSVGDLAKIVQVRKKLEPVAVAPVTNLIDNSEIMKELEELRAFKAMAVAKYPGLAVKPEIIEGRKVLVEFFTRTGETNKVEQAKNGQLDHVPMMQAVIIALDK